jgi:hypothetical protein
MALDSDPGRSIPGRWNTPRIRYISASRLCRGVDAEPISGWAQFLLSRLVVTEDGRDRLDVATSELSQLFAAHSSAALGIEREPLTSLHGCSPVRRLRHRAGWMNR